MIVFLFFMGRIIFLSNKQMVYPGVFWGLPPPPLLCSPGVRRRGGCGRVREAVQGINLFKSGPKKTVHQHPPHLQAHFHMTEASVSASDVALRGRTLAPSLRVRSCILDKHRTSQMFTKNVCQPVFGGFD